MKLIITTEETGKVRPIGIRNVATILLLGTTGQIAWILENTWFNTFVYDRITKDPSPIAWMVAVSAIVATVTTLVMGAFSDRTRGRFGKRKPYIVLGYIAWGIVTALYPLTSWIQLAGVAVVMVIFTDAVMTFFGSTANDAAFNAWLTDIGHSSNRNRIQSLNSLTSLLASIVGLGAAGAIIDSLGYFFFFYALGGIVSVSGLIGAFLITPSSASNADEAASHGTTIWQDFKSLLDPRIFRSNRILFLLFLNMMISGIASQIYTPYILIFLQYYLGFSKTEMSIYLGIFIIITVIFIAVMGYVSHRFNRWTLIVFGTVAGSIMFILVGIVAPFLRGNSAITIWAVFIYFIGSLPGYTSSIAHGGWLQDTYPEGNVGKFQGVRMIFFVLLPMIIGPPIGAAIIEAFGISDGAGGFIPTPEIFLVGGIISFFAIFPILLIDKTKGIVKLDVSKN